MLFILRPCFKFQTISVHTSWVCRVMNNQIALITTSLMTWKLIQGVDLHITELWMPVFLTIPALTSTAYLDTNRNTSTWWCHFAIFLHCPRSHWQAGELGERDGNSGHLSLWDLSEQVVYCTNKPNKISVIWGSGSQSGLYSPHRGPHQVFTGHNRMIENGRVTETFECASKTSL